MRLSYMYSGIEQYLFEIRNILHAGLPVRQTTSSGKTAGFTMTLTVGDPVTRIFFSHYQDNSGVPKNTVVFGIHQHFKTLIVVNEGPADIMYQVNGDASEERLTSILRYQEERQVQADQGTAGIFSFFAKAVPAGGPTPLQTPWGNLTLNQCFLRIECIT